MGVYYHYVNFTKRERFAVGALGGGVKLYNLGYTLASRAFHLMLVGEPNLGFPSPRLARWSGDSIAIVGDDLIPDWERFQRDFTDIEANAIMIVFGSDGFEQIGEVAQCDTGLFMELCHLVVTRQALELEPHMNQAFGERYLHRYKQLCKERSWFRPLDLAVAAG